MTGTSAQVAIERAETHAAEIVARDGAFISDLPPAKELAMRGRISLADMNVDPDDRVSAQTEQELIDAMPGNTKKQARYVWGRWLWWCGKTGRHHGDPQQPANPSSLREWITDHWILRPPVESRGEVGGQPYAYNTVENAVYIICMIHGWMGHASPAKDKRIEKQLAAYEKKWKKHAGYKVRRAFALPHDGSVEVARSYDLTTVAGLRNAAAFRMQWDLMARASDLVADPKTGHEPLQRRHLRWTAPGEKVTVSILDPKEGGEREVSMQAVLWLEEVVDGATVKIAHPYADVDPVALLWRWCQALDAAGYTDPRTPLFHDVYSGYARKDGTLAGKILETPWTVDMYEQTWTYAVTRKTNIAERYAGPSVSFGTHMNRRGPISAAVRNRIPLEMVAKRSGHSPASPIIHEYYDTGEQWDEQNPAVLIRTAEGKKARGGGLG